MGSSKKGKKLKKDLRVRDNNPKGGRARTGTFVGCCTLKNILTC